MEFIVKTNPPKSMKAPALAADKAEEIKSLLFSAVALYVKDDDSAKQELMDFLTAGSAGEEALAS